MREGGRGGGREGRREGGREVRKCMIERMYTYILHIINPRCACAARVTVLGLSVLPSVCPVPLILALRATRRPKSATNRFSATLA